VLASAGSGPGPNGRPARTEGAGHACFGRRTASTHDANLLAKLVVANRAEAASVASAPGTYAAFCFVEEPGGVAHAERGMWFEFTVGGTGTPEAATTAG
jgi:hypothetical protein